MSWMRPHAKAPQHAGPEKAVWLQEPRDGTLVPVQLLSTKGARESTAFVSLSMLPESQLLVVGGEDGHIRICS